MSRQQAQEIPVELEGELLEEQENVERINQDIEADILENVNSADAATKWRLYASRIVPGSRRERECFNIDPGELKQKNLQDRLRDGHGSGLYRIRVYKNRRINNQYDVEIEAGLTPVVVAEPKNDLSGIVELMRESNRQTMELFSRLEQRMTVHVPVAPTVATIDPMEMVTKTIAMITAMQSAMPKPENNMLELVKMGMELRGEAEGGNSPGMWSVLEKLAEKIDLSKINFAAPQSPSAPRTIEQQPPARVAPPAPEHAPQPRPASGNGSIFAPFVPQIRMLITKAERKDEAEFWAEFLLMELPEAAIETLVTTENVIGEFEKLEPRVTPHRLWFDTVLAIMREEWQNKGEVAEETVSEQRLHPANGATGDTDGDT